MICTKTILSYTLQGCLSENAVKHKQKATILSEHTIKSVVCQHVGAKTKQNTCNRHLQETLTIDTYNGHLQRTLTTDTCNRLTQ